MSTRTKSSKVLARTNGGKQKETLLTRRRFQRGRLIELQHGWSARYVEDVVVDGITRRKKKQVFLGGFDKIPTRPMAKKAMQSALAVVNNERAPESTSTFRERAAIWIADCKTRTLKPSTLSNWQSILDNHLLPILGDMTLSNVRAKVVKVLVAGLVRKDLKHQTIKNIVQVVKLVVNSLTDEDDEPIYPTKWKNKKLSIPPRDEDNTPAFDGAGEVENLIKAASGRLQMIAILLAASGLRVGEVFGLEVRHFDGYSVKVEQEAWGKLIQPPKTKNAKRVVDLHPSVCALLKAYIGKRTIGFIFQTNTRKPLRQSNILRRELHPLLESVGIRKCGFHSFRRYRNTFLCKNNCPDGLVKFWLGHAKKGMTDRYNKMQRDVAFRREVATAVGIGFALPENLTPKRKQEVLISDSDANGRQPETATAMEAA